MSIEGLPEPGPEPPIEDVKESEANEQEENDATGPQVGVGLLVVKQNLERPDQVLLGRRKGSHWPGYYQGPGGGLEDGQAAIACALEELREEVGPQLKVVRMEQLCETNMAYSTPHFWDIGYLAVWKSGEPKVMEPDKNEFWRWFDITKEGLPHPLMPGLSNYLAAYVVLRTLGMRPPVLEGEFR